MSAETELYPPLPDDIPKAVWSAWPRKSEAHLRFHVRKRSVTNKILAGTVRCYACPDESVRIPIDQLDAAFADSKPAGSDDSPAPARPVSVSRARLRELMPDKELELDDPIVGMFRECRVMLREERQHTRDILKDEREHFRLQLDGARDTNEKQLQLLVNPIGAATKLLQETAARLAERVTFLEERQDSVIAERELMADFRQVRDVELEQIKGREQRRSEVLKLLKRELGPVLVSKLGGDSLAGFVANVRPELVSMLINSGLLSVDQQAKLERIQEHLAKSAAERAAESKATEPPPPPEPEPPPPNGVNGAAATQEQRS